MKRPSGRVFPAGAVCAVAMSAGLVGCGEKEYPPPGIPEGIDRIVITYPSREPPYDPQCIVVVESRTVQAIIDAVENSVWDSTLYDDAKSISLSFCRGAECLDELWTSGSLFMLNGYQYRDAAGEFERIVMGMVRCGAALVNSVQVGQLNYVMGETISVDCSVKNAGDVDVRIPTAALLSVSWARRSSTCPGAWESSSDMVFNVESGDTLSSDPTYISTGESHAYLVEIPTTELEQGEIFLAVSFQEATGEGAGAPDVVLPPGFELVVTVE